MKKTILIGLSVFMFAFLFSSCESDLYHQEQIKIPTEDILILENMGFDVSMVEDNGDNYIIDGDIIVPKSELPLYAQIPQTRQGIYNYRVRAEKQSSILVKIDPSVHSSWAQAAQRAIEAWNGLGTKIEMQITTGSNYDIIVRTGTQLGVGVLAQAQYPSSSGNPGSLVQVNEAYVNRYAVNQLTSVMVHEFGHTLGFVHSNWSISGNVPAQYITEIPGTPSSYNDAYDGESIMYSHYSGKSWDSCSFTDYDKIAAYYVYSRADLAITGSSVADTRETYSYTVNYNRKSPYIIEWDFPSGTDCIYSYDKSIKLKFSSPGIYNVRYRVTQGTCSTEWKVKTIEVFDNLNFDRWHIKNLRMNGTQFISYDLVYKSSRSYFDFGEVHVLFLYRGTYDNGMYSNYIWDWEWDSYRNEYVIPTVRPEHGTSDWFPGFSSAGGNIYMRRVLTQRIYTGYNISDLEVVNIYRRTHNGNSNRFHEEIWL